MLALMAMRLTLSLILTCFLLGCATHPQKVPAPKTSDLFNVAAPAQLETAKQRIHLLRAEMTDQQVFATLGLSNCYGRCLAHGNDLCASYVLRSGRVLGIMRDWEGPHAGTIRSVSVDGERLGAQVSIERANICVLVPR
jgi:hypothetical protein